MAKCKSPVEIHVQNKLGGRAQTLWYGTPLFFEELEQNRMTFIELAVGGLGLVQSGLQDTVKYFPLFVGKKGSDCIRETTEVFVQYSNCLG